MIKTILRQQTVIEDVLGQLRAEKKLLADLQEAVDALLAANTQPVEKSLPEAK